MAERYSGPPTKGLHDEAGRVQNCDRPEQSQKIVREDGAQRISPHIKRNQLQGGFKKDNRCNHWTGLSNLIVKKEHSRGEEMRLVALDC